MLKSAAKPFLFALVASTALVACGKAPTTMTGMVPEYKLTFADKQSLDSVGCSVQNSAILCPDPADDGKQSKAENATRKQKIAADRKTVLDRVEASIRAAMALQKFDPKGQIDPKKLHDSIVVESGNQQSKAKSLQVESDFQTITGYHCEASHSQNGADASKPVLNSGDITIATPQPIGIADESSSFVANLALATPSNQISLSLADKTQAAKFQASLRTDAEFVLNTTASGSAIPQSSINCSHTRKGGQQKPFSDRIEAQTNYQCSMTTVINGNSTVSKVALSSAATDQNATFDLLQLSNNLSAMQLGLQAKSSNGFLTLTIGNPNTKKTIAEATIPNSARTIELAVDTKDGNSVALSCTAN